MPRSVARKLLSVQENEDECVLDPSTICASWYRLWSSFGFTDHQWSSRAVKVEEYTRQLLRNKQSIYKEQLNKRRALVKQSIEDYEELIARTGLPTGIDIRSFERLKLKEQEVQIEKKTQDLIVDEGQLLHRRTELEHRQEQLCALLNATPREFDDSPMSLRERNTKLQDHIQMLNDLKEHRLGQIGSYYSVLKEHAARLEWTPNSSIITHLFQREFDQCLSADSLNEIERTLHELENRLKGQKARFVLLQAQLQHLCERLGKEMSFGDAEHCKASDIRRLEEEIARCREERLKNGNEYCQVIHQQLVEFLDKAHLGRADRSRVENLLGESLSSDLLDRYDAEFERLEGLYEKRRVVLDAYEKWLRFWNEFVAFTKSSTDPARFRTRGYNAQVEGRQRKKFLRELPLIEEEFLRVLSEHSAEPFLIGDVPIREKFEHAHHQVPGSSTAKTVVAVAPSPRPAQSRTLAVTPRRLPKTPAATPGRRLLPPVSSQVKRAHLTPSHPVVALPVHPPARTDDQTLDFSLIHTMKNVHGQMKVMTSTPNSSLVTVEKAKNEQGRTAHNPIHRRRSNRLMLLTHDDTVPCI